MHEIGFLVDFEGYFGGFVKDEFSLFQSEISLHTIGIHSELGVWTHWCTIGEPNKLFLFQNYGEQHHGKFFGPGLKPDIYSKPQNCIYNGMPV